LVRKSFGDPVAEDLRFVVKAVVGEENFVDMFPNRSNNYCCGGGGGFLQSGLPEARRASGMDGMEVLSHIQQLNPEILVIIITGYATLETAIEAMKQGAYDFIAKPFEPDQLRIVINRG